MEKQRKYEELSDLERAAIEWQIQTVQEKRLAAGGQAIYLKNNREMHAQTLRNDYVTSPHLAKIVDAYKIHLAQSHRISPLSNELSR